MSVAPPTKEQDIQPPASPTGVWDFLFTPFLNSDDDNQNNNNNKADLDDNNSVDTGCFSILSQGNLAPVPERLVDYFCVVGPDLKKVESVAAKPSDLALNAKLMDCYPPNRTDLAFPNELPMFCLPNGCQLSTYKVAPTISTVVLTSSSGNRIYGSVLTMYEEVPLADLCSAFWKGECSLPRWLEEPQPFYLPKCLVVISHHAFFHVQTTFLSQLYRIAMSGRSPLPLERYIANFVNDIPLPRPGATSITWKCFTNDTTVEFRRPPANDLPLVNFSYRPLFHALSVSNIITVWAILLQEGRVALRSENVSLLTPIAEAFNSLLFPLMWQGIYVPVLPSNMMDVLDAPVPFFVGCVGSTCPQPPGVVICDLDQDIVHLGMDDHNQPRSLPQLPKQLVAKLKLDLEDIAHSLYLVPPCGIQGRVTSAVYGLLENAKREPYAHMVELRNPCLTNIHRHYILSHASQLPDDLPPLTDRDFVMSGEERTKYKTLDSSSNANATKHRKDGGSFFKALRRQGRAIQMRTDRAIASTPAGAGRLDDEMEKKRKAIAAELYTMDDDLAHSVRRSFLRFFSVLLVRYKEFTRHGMFRTDAFINSLTELSYGNRLYVESMVNTQMFERFLMESSTRRRLFDEHVLLQLNGNALIKNKSTPFWDEQEAVRKIIIPAAPCFVGVRRGRKFKYDKGFPKLDTEEMISNKNLDPVSALCYLGADVFCGAAEW